MFLQHGGLSQIPQIIVSENKRKFSGWQVFYTFLTIEIFSLPNFNIVTNIDYFGLPPVFKFLENGAVGYGQHDNLSIHNSVYFLKQILGLQDDFGIT